MFDELDSARVESRQIPIFPRNARAASSRIALDWSAAQRLFKDGWLSFDPTEERPLDEAREAELIFLGTLVVAGCSRSLLRLLLRDLQRPYAYDLRRMFFEWSSRRWRLLPGEDDPEEAFFALLERLRERREREVLLSIRLWLDEALDLVRDRTMVFTHRNGHRPEKPESFTS